MKKSHIAALLVMVIALGAVISTLYRADTYSSFSEARNYPGRDVQIIGTLVPDEPIREQLIDGRQVLSFSLRDRDGVESQVRYFGPKPMDFERSDQVVLIGRYTGDEGFVAGSLLLKCPSKYSPDDMTPLEFEEKRLGDVLPGNGSPGQ